MNKMARKYVQWDHLASKYGSTSVLDSFLSKLMIYLSDSEVKDFARWTGDGLFKDYVLFWFQTFDIDNVLKAIRLLSIAGNFEHDEQINDKTRSIIMKHHHGHKWSLYYEELFNYVFRNQLQTEVRLESSENLVLLQVPSRRKAILENFYEDL